MKYLIDIDNTICNTINSDYEHSTPIQNRIDSVNKLFDQGHQIIYWTARGGNSGKDWLDFTRKQLVSWGCKFNDILFNKPSYDLYIDDKSVSVDTYWPLVKCDCSNDSRKESSVKVHKGWGYEIIFVNNEKYCGKILHFNTDGKFSMHYHLIKQETWYVNSGRFLFRYIDTTNAELKEIDLNIGDVVTNKIGQPHQIICLEEGDIFEVSTQHFDSDSYRVMKGDSQ